ncbi:hypothetical protein V6N11_016340 [Hibiscus sabdariffa]|uniref:non-specific serine/threonine protein kinase n=1 Tax=Hibiscus sabdariffa TaxID=183260 RepID=A0ABR2TUW9_9ROSI
MPSLPFLLFSLLFLFPVSHSNPELLFENCHYKKFACGDISIGYPFFGGDRQRECGHPGLELHCDDDTDTVTIEIRGVKYKVKSIDHELQTLRIAMEDFLKDGFCRSQTPIQDSIIDLELFDLAPGYSNVTLFYDCPSSSSSVPSSPPCNDSYYQNVSVITDDFRVEGCSANVTFPISKEKIPFHNVFDLLQSLGETLETGFEVKWKEDTQACRSCNASGGACGFNIFNSQTSCFCPFGFQNSIESPNQCLRPGGNNHRNPAKLGLGLGIAGAVIVVILAGIGILCFRQRRQKKITAQTISRDLLTSPSSKGPSTSITNTSQTNSSYDIERGSTYFGAHVFSYEELEEATNKFNPSKQLGEGGFGTVYYGVLRDGRVVAVKRLYYNNFKRVDRYMNEIEILTRIRHPNLVALYGCTSRRSRELLLVYEFIQNGTVADHLHGKRSNSTSLTWQVRLSIAVETAKALAYLHASEIIHRDVKSNNILLDNNFHVKVADFGLSRLFPTDVTHISTAPQGTPGYVDPEYHRCYQLTEKSDVYSFGVVLMELVSAKQAVDINRHRHDINLANMAISRIQNQALHELIDPTLGFENNCAVKNAVTMVAELAFRCLQQDRDMRPSMGEVLETLKEIKDGKSGAEVVDIKSDDVGLLKSVPPALSPDYSTDKWVQIKSM